MNKTPVFFLACALAAALSACSGTARKPEAPLEGARIGGPFTLVNQDGKTVKDSDFAGKFRIIYFGYSYCPDVCPVDMNRLMLGFRQFERSDASRAAQVQPIFISVDPARDTAAIRGRFAAQFHPRLLALSGTAQQVRTAADAYLVRYARQEGSRPDAYLISHNQFAYLMGPAGEPVAMLPLDDPRTPVDEGAPALVAADLDRWVR